MKNAQSTSASPLEVVEQKEAKTLTCAILDELSEDYRTVLILFEFQGMSGEEIAALTGTNVANVWLRLHRARKQFLRRLLAWEAKQADGDSEAREGRAMVFGRNGIPRRTVPGGSPRPAPASVTGREDGRGPRLGNA